MSFSTTAVQNNGTDLNVWEVNETFPTYGPLYRSGDEAGRSAVIFRCGTQRRAEIIANDQLKGWTCGVGDGQMRWGGNKLEGRYGSLVKITFDLGGSPNEVHLFPTRFGRENLRSRARNLETGRGQLCH